MPAFTATDVANFELVTGLALTAAAMSLFVWWTRRAGSSNPLLRIALLTRSRASWTWLPASPTIVSAGMPNATSTSTRTGTPSTPRIEAHNVSASTTAPRPGGDSG